MSSSNGYPFMSRRAVVEKIAADPAFAAECVAILQRRYEQRASGGGESMGWMASHAAKATKLAAKLASGAATEKELGEATQLVKNYTRQLARVFRDRDLAQRPELSAQAAVFGVGTTEAGPQPSAGGSPAVPPHPSEPATEPAEGVPAPRKRGRPRGSKNKPKTDQPIRRRRSRT